MIHLIANTGIQFVTTEMDFNPSEPVMVNDVPLPPLYFAEYPSGEPNINWLTSFKTPIFLCQNCVPKSASNRRWMPMVKKVTV